MAKDFERKYSLEIPKLNPGDNADRFEIDSSFFDEFDSSSPTGGELVVQVNIAKNEHHLDATFHFSGLIQLECDRCLENYPFELDFEQRVVYAYDEDLTFDMDEVIVIDENLTRLSLSKDFFDFICLQVPLRKVPESSVHECPEEVLEMLGLVDGEEAPKEAEEEEIDPRWAALKNLKYKDNL